MHAGLAHVGTSTQVPGVRDAEVTTTSAPKQRRPYINLSRPESAPLVLRWTTWSRLLAFSMPVGWPWPPPYPLR
jgi:hypothetical protein